MEANEWGRMESIGGNASDMTFIDFFSGIGGIRLGMEAAGHECIGFCEYDKYAVMSYVSMHLLTDEQMEHLRDLPLKERQKEILKEGYRNGEWYANDIRRVESGDIPRADCWCFGAPCLVAGTLITTEDGIKNIEDVEIGEKVLTHRHRFREVTNRMVNVKKGIYTLTVQGSPKSECTGNHRFYVRYRNRIWNNERQNYDTEWTEPEWKAIEDFTGEEYILFPDWDGAYIPDGVSDDEIWLIGRYIADGYLQCYARKGRPSPCRRIAWCIGTQKDDEFIRHLNGIKYHTEDYGSCRKYISMNKRMYELCSDCGRGAANKVIPGWVMKLPQEKMRIFLDGYLSGDGCREGNHWNATSVSRRLIYQLGRCAYRAYKTPYSVTYYKRPATTVIEGRTVHQKSSWNLQFREKLEKNSSGHIVDGELWMKVKKISCEPDRVETVYNLEVKDDNSYTANNMGLHNCQSFSVAGGRDGLEGKSGLIREIFRLLRETDERDRPEWLFYENVKGMFSSNRGFDYLAILLEMDGLGYDVEWQLLNSKDFGVPQNRERVFTIGHLRSHGRAEVLPVEGADGEDSMEVVSPGAEQIGRYGFAANRENPNQYRVYDPNGVCATLTDMGGGGREPHTIERVATEGERGGWSGRIIPIGKLTPARHSDRDIHDPRGIVGTLQSRDYKEPKMVAVDLLGTSTHLVTE